MRRPRGRPCPSCPYRRGVPSGIWSAEDYAGLAAYDGDTGEQALAGATRLFGCHQGDDKLCAGWVGCHDMNHSLALRLHHAETDLPAVLGYSSPVPLFPSGAEAAAHGMRDIENPSPAARAMIAKITRVRAARGRPVQ